jgi:hypothetical protein
MNVYVYIHIACINNYKDVFCDLITKIKESGLYDVITEIRCCVLGSYDKEIFDDSKIVIWATNDNLKSYEKFTINKIKSDAETEEFKFLYLHTKGVTKPNNINIKKWVNYMCYFNIYKHDLCLNLLDENDTVGVEMIDHRALHYSGNFWWSKTDYVKKLRKCDDGYYDPEIWLCKDRIGKYVNLWNTNCNINLYTTPYNEDKYENMPIEIKLFEL